MNRRHSYILLAFLASAFFFQAVGLSGWSCRGHAFSSNCTDTPKVLTTGIILALAGGAATIGGILLFAVIATNSYGSFVTAPCFYIIATALSISGVVYYNLETHIYSPIFAICGMSIITTISLILIIEYIVGTF
ncbi:unnamed protein product [Hymenolepis diminuta]|uniref:DUF4064 domain-containing protein n=1 Tax=Hymenolepis diminuta TaxID=6216 RepID=A0A0R3SG62_HYMDI|nr:unnamed protein product [Hymenolepis diminuta]VUZ46378.1 unnamed protein product [Hymenolepis diminuta]